MAIQAYFLPAIYDLRVSPGSHRPGVGFSESATRFISPRSEVPGISIPIEISHRENSTRFPPDSRLSGSPANLPGLAPRRAEPSLGSSICFYFAQLWCIAIYYFIKLQFPKIRISLSVCVSVCHVQNMFTEKDYLGFAEQKDSDEIGGWQVGLEVVDFAYGAS